MSWVMVSMSFSRAANKPSARHLLDLVSSLLDYHKLESNKMEINQVPFNPAQLFQTIYTSFRPLAEKKNLQLFYHDNERLNRFYTGDPFRIRQIAENLLSNAIKFTDHGFIAFHAWREDSKLFFRVSDTGRGIGPEERERIYQEFVRLPSAGGVGGVGLGLSIVDRLVKLLGGTIELESEPGAGSRFIVSIPVEMADSLKIVPSSSTRPNAVLVPPISIPIASFFMMIAVVYGLSKKEISHMVCRSKLI